MIPIILGTDLPTNLPYYLNPDLLRTHLHAIGATGSGKSTLIVSIVKSLLRNPRPRCALFLVDPVGNLSHDLLTWMADRKTCPQHVADRLVYLEPANEKWVLPFHPLRSQSEEHLYYQAGRSMEIVLRGWASQNVEQMPRLRYWTFACFFALAAMGLPLAASRWLLRPGTDEHKALLARLPEGVRSMWAEILAARGGEALRQLESTRSRLTLFADCGILRRMFGVAQNRFDVARFIHERRIVLVNVGSYGILDQQIGKTIGGFVVNEVIQTAMSLTSKEVNPTYLVLDEFQHFVGPDLYEALPLVRQLGLRLILAHQSFSQLERGDIDLTGIIWQARSRLMFANSAKDASIIAEELAKLTFDPYRLKDLLTSERQLIVDFRRELMKSSSYTHSDSTAKETGNSHGDGTSTGSSRAPEMTLPTISTGRQGNTTHSQSEKTGHADAHGESVSEALVPVHKNFQEVSSKTFFSFEEQQLDWERRVRELKTGYAFGTFKDDPKLYHLKITEQKTIETPRLRDRKEELLAKNFESDCFVSKAAIEQEEERLRLALLAPPAIVIPTTFTPIQTLPALPSAVPAESDSKDAPPIPDQTATPPSPPPPANRFL